jgi:hypothetical protein
MSAIIIAFWSLIGIMLGATFAGAIGALFAWGLVLVLMPLCLAYQPHLSRMFSRLRAGKVCTRQALAIPVTFMGEDDECDCEQCKPKPKRVGARQLEMFFTMFALFTIFLPKFS